MVSSPASALPRASLREVLRRAAAVVAATLKEDGPRGFFRGAGPRVSIFSGLYGVLFLSYEFANKLLGI